MMEFLPYGAKNKYIFARPLRVTQTLLKYIAVERFPHQYNGFEWDNDDEFLPDDKAMCLVAKGLTVQSIKVPMAEVTYLVLGLCIRDMSPRACPQFFGGQNLLPNGRFVPGAKLSD